MKNIPDENNTTGVSEEVALKLSLLIDNVLSDDERAEVTEWLAQSPEANALYQAMQQSSASLQNYAESIPFTQNPYLWQQISESLKSETFETNESSGFSENENFSKNDSLSVIDGFSSDALAASAHTPTDRLIGLPESSELSDTTSVDLKDLETHIYQNVQASAMLGNFDQVQDLLKTWSDNLEKNCTLHDLKMTQVVLEKANMPTNIKALKRSENDKNSPYVFESLLSKLADSEDPNQPVEINLPNPTLNDSKLGTAPLDDDSDNETIQDALSAYLDGELPPKETIEVSSKIESTPAIKETFHGMTQVSSLLHDYFNTQTAALEPPVQSVWPEIKEALMQSPSNQPLSSNQKQNAGKLAFLFPKLAPFPRTVAAAIAVIVLLGSAQLLNQSGLMVKQSQPPGGQKLAAASKPVLRSADVLTPSNTPTRETSEAPLNNDGNMDPSAEDYLLSVLNSEQPDVDADMASIWGKI
ncbi:MAG: hypothetical protein AAGI66_05955 [Cyanobacteria bacterium P01_H01_bin.74]